MFDQVTANKRRSAVLIFCFVILVALVALAVDQLVAHMGPAGFVLAIVISGVSAFVSYWKSDAIALAMSHARPAYGPEYARLHNLIEGLCIAAGLPKPRVYVVDDSAPNAFATGRNPQHAAIAVTTGLMEKMNRVELEGVLAHELSHIKNYDVLVSTLAVTMVGAIAILTDLSFRMMWWGGLSSDDRDNDNGRGGPLQIVFMVLALLTLILAPIAARMMQFSISRKRESLADISGVEITRYPPGLISALEKLRDDTTVVRSASNATAHLWIEQPTAKNVDEGRNSRLNRMFMTHPPLEERIATLKEL